MPKARNAERSDFEVEGITEIRLECRAEHINTYPIPCNLDVNQNLVAAMPYLHSRLLQITMLKKVVQLTYVLWIYPKHSTE